MARPLSQVAPEWWDYTTLDPEILSDAAKLTEKSLFKLSRPGFTVHYHETLEDFYLAEALEYVESWQKATADNPVGLCGPIGPTEQLPLVARIVNSLGINLRYAHFWGMDEWVENGKPVGIDHPLSFAKADFEMCFNRIDKKLRMPKENIHFPSGDLKAYSKTYDQIECAIMQGGQGDTKHWAFNDPVRRKGKYKDNPPTPEEYRKLATRVTELHPITVLQNARTSNGGYVANVAREAATVGPVETWKAKKVSIWQAGTHDNPFGMRLSAWMIAKKIPDSAVPMSLLADHPNVHFHYWRPAIKTVGAEMH
ncbi:MAG: glucosamine-6-phosphate isomerase [Thermoguttaceae bacterium]|nr:glucosamine-6-phosphate isomerase [Thermoguttaceae bacterium]MBQ6619049.1 glucosamine-6-phosphate isomerase [Thermoguttaceae bacterium]